MIIMRRHRPTCEWQGCNVIVKRRPERTDSERRLSARAAPLARERGLLSDQRHDVVCDAHRKQIDRLLQLPADIALPPPPGPAPALPPPSAPAHSASVLSGVQHAPLGQGMAALLLATEEVTHAIVRSTSLPAYLHLPFARAVALADPAARPLAFSDLCTPTHPYTSVAQLRQEPRLRRSLTGQLHAAQLEERQRPDGARWTSNRAQRAISSYQRQWESMLAAGGNQYAHWPLLGMASILEKTICSSWDGEDGVQPGQSQQGCQSFMRLVGMHRVIHDHIRLRLHCRGQACGRVVTISNQSAIRRQYSGLPDTIKQRAFKPHILKLVLFLVAAGCHVSTTQRMWQLQSQSAIAPSTHYAYQHVVWLAVRETFDAEMEHQRRRQEVVAARHGDNRRRLVLSADGSWAHKGYNSKQFSYVVLDASRDLYTIERETEQEREERLCRGRPRPPVVYMAVLHKGRAVPGYVRARAVGPGAAEQKYDVKGDEATEEEEEELKEDVEGNEGGEATEGTAGAANGAKGEGDARRGGRDITVKPYINKPTYIKGGGSAPMEPDSFITFMDAIEQDGRLQQLSTLVVDQDLTVSAMMRNKYPQVRVATDPGHVRKSLRKSFHSVFTSRKPFRYIAYRVVAWIMRTLKTSEEATDRIVDDGERAAKIVKLQQLRMTQAVWHYFNVCGDDCPHRQQSAGVETDSTQLLEDLANARAEAKREEHREGTGVKEGEGEDEDADQEGAIESMEEEEVKEQEKLTEEEEELIPREEDEGKQQIPKQEDSEVKEEEPRRRRGRSVHSMAVPGSDDEFPDEDLALALSLSEVQLSQVTTSEVEESSQVRARRGRPRGRGGARAATRGRRRGGRGQQASDDDSDYASGPDVESSRQQGKGDRSALLINKHRATIDAWQAEIVARAKEKKKDEESNAPQRWGTHKAEEEKVTAALRLQSFRWKMWLDVDATYDQRTRCWEKFLAIMADQCLPEQMEAFCHGYNTCLQESFNNARLQFTSKTRSYWVSFESRVQCAVLKWNLGHSFVARVAERMQLQLTEEELATLKKLDAVKDREARRRQRPEMRRKVAMRAKEVEMRTRQQQLLNETEKKDRDKEKRQAEMHVSGGADSVQLASPLAPRSQLISDAAPLISSPVSRASSSSSPRSVAARRSYSLRYKSPAEKKQPFPTSVEGSQSLTSAAPKKSSRKRTSTEKENGSPSSDGEKQERKVLMKDEGGKRRNVKRARRALAELTLN